MFWDLVFLALFVVLFLGMFYLLRWGNDKRTVGDKDSWKFTNPGNGGV